MYSQIAMRHVKLNATYDLVQLTHQMIQSKFAGPSDDHDDSDERGGGDGISAKKSPELQNVTDLVDISV